MVHLGKVNYKNSMVNFASALMKNYNIHSEYEASALVEYLLSKKYRHVVVIMLDGLGINVIDSNLGNGSILKTHQIMTLNSVYPPTTVAATTAFKTGKAPIESGWLGWHLYLKENDPSIVLFKNKEYLTNEDFTKYQVEDIIDATPWYKTLRGTKTYTINPSWGENGVENFSDGIEQVKEICTKDEKNFTFFYWDNPDYLMHEYGINSQVVKVNLFDIEANIEKLSNELPNDTIVFITADHGMIDVEAVELNRYPDLINCLSKPFAGEGRCAQFYVKDDMHDDFVNTFNKYFKESFKLFTKKEFIESKLAGAYQVHDVTNVALGDYVAVGIGEYFFVQEIKEDDLVFKAHHAGLTQEEMQVPVILLKRKDEKEDEE